MRFSFDESEIINIILEQQSETPGKEELTKIINDIKKITEDPDLIRIYNSIAIKFKQLNEVKYNELISKLPVETLTNY